MEPSADPSERTRNPASNSEAFAELSRLARESRSSWAENTPGRNTDRAFLLLIVIAIIVLSGIIMIAGYRQQLSEKFGALVTRASETDGADASTSLAVPAQAVDGGGSGNSNSPSSVELELKVKNLEERMALLQQKLTRLETRTQPEVSAPAHQTTPTAANTRTGDPVTVESETEPALVGANTAPATTSAGASAPTTAADPDADRQSTPTVPIGPDPVATRTAGSAAESQSATAASGWYINLAAYSRQASAKPLYERARKIARADIQEVVTGAGTIYRVRAVGYPSPEAARQDARRIESLLGLKDSWVSNK